MRRIGFLVNPIAGMGGAVGLKGTDGVVEEARRLGAEPRSPERARRALRALRETGVEVELFTWGEPMGTELAADLGFPIETLGEPSDPVTGTADTGEAVRAFLEHGVDLILFVGGDGTAVDIASVLEGENAEIPMIGVPAGVKIFSSVFGVTPEAAGRIAGTYERTEAREVADIDEVAYREGEVRSTLRAVVEVPVDEEVQSTKQLRTASVEGVVAGTIARVDPDTTYFLGPGSTVGAIKRELGFVGTPLGVDIWRDGTLLKADAAAADLQRHLDGQTTIIVSPIGGQGFVFGRGNQQFTPDVIRASEIEIVATRTKLDDTGVLRVDTGDLELDEELRGWVKVRVGRVERRMVQIV